MTGNPDDTSPHAPSGSVGNPVEPVGLSPQEGAAFPRGGHTKGNIGSEAAERRGGLGRFAWWFLALLWGYAVYRLGTLWYTYEHYSFGWFMPLLCLMLLWERWKRRPQREAVRAGPSTLLVLAFFACLLAPAALVLEVIPHWRLAAWFFALAVLAITIIGFYFIGGKSYSRYFTFPVLLFLIAVPWPLRLEQPLIEKLSKLNAAVSASAANHLGTPAIRRGVLIETGAGLVGVDEACSGIRSFQASVMVGLFLGELMRFGLLRRMLLLVGGVGIAFFCNVVRTTYLVRTCDLKGVEGVNLYHDQAGFTILGITFAGLMVLAWGLSRSGKQEVGSEGEWRGKREKEVERGSLAEAGNQKAKSEEPSSLSPVTPVGWLRTALIAVGVWGIATEVGIEWWFGSAERLAERRAEWSFKLPTHSLEFKQTPLGRNVQDLLSYDDGAMAEWRDNQGRNWRVYYFLWLPVQTRYQAVRTKGRIMAHTAAVCLPYSGMALATNLGSRILVPNGIPIQTQSERFSAAGRSFYVMSCYWDPVMPKTKPAYEGQSSTRRGLQIALDAVKNHDRAMTEKRVLKIGVWDMESDEAAQAAFKEYLEQMVVRGEGAGRRQKAEDRSQRAEVRSENRRRLRAKG